MVKSTMIESQSFIFKIAKGAEDIFDYELNLLREHYNLKLEINLENKFYDSSYTYIQISFTDNSELKTQTIKSIITLVYLSQMIQSVYYVIGKTTRTDNSSFSELLNSSKNHFENLKKLHSLRFNKNNSQSTNFSLRLKQVYKNASEQYVIETKDSKLQLSSLTSKISSYISSKNNLYHSYTSENKFYLFYIQQTQQDSTANNKELKSIKSIQSNRPDQSNQSSQIQPELILSANLFNGLEKRYYHLYATNDSLRGDISASLVYSAIKEAKLLNSQKKKLPSKPKVLNPFMNDGSVIIELTHILNSIPLRENQKEIFMSDTFFALILFLQQKYSSKTSALTSNSINKIKKLIETTINEINREAKTQASTPINSIDQKNSLNLKNTEQTTDKNQILIYGFETMPDFIKSKKNMKVDDIEYLINTAEYDFIESQSHRAFHHNTKIELKYNFFDIIISYLNHKKIYISKTRNKTKQSKDKDKQLSYDTQLNGLELNNIKEIFMKTQRTLKQNAVAAFALPLPENNRVTSESDSYKTFISLIKKIALEHSLQLTFHKIIKQGQKDISILIFKRL